MDPDTQATAVSPLAIYAQREAEASAEAQHWNTRSNALAQQRMWVFLMGTVAFVAYAFASDAKPAIMSVGLILALVFIRLIVLHRQAREREG